MDGGEDRVSAAGDLNAEHRPRSRDRTRPLADTFRASHGWSNGRSHVRGPWGTNGCSPFVASGRHPVIHLSTIGRASASRLRSRHAPERVVGKGRAPPARDGILGHGHADFTRCWRTGPQDFDKGRPGGDAEDQAHGQERELADGHEAGISRVQSSRTEGSIRGPA